jgi:hypothetical protein
MPATKANATASGTSARATVKPDKMSFFGLKVKLLNSFFIYQIISKKSGKYSLITYFIVIKQS